MSDQQVVVNAPDGTPFSDLKSYRRYIFVNYFCFKGTEGQELTKYPGEINGQEFQIDKLKDCKVEILDHTDRVIATNLENCKVFIGPSKESVAIRKCVGCVFTVASKEVRLTGCNGCEVRVFSPSQLLLDDCHTIKVGKFNGAYSGLTQHFHDASLEPNSNQVKVMDFSSRDTELPKPHFTMMKAEEEESEEWVVDLPNASGPPENPVKNPGGPSNPPPEPVNPPPDLNPSFEPQAVTEQEEEQVNDLTNGEGAPTDAFGFEQPSGTQESEAGDNLNDDDFFGGTSANADDIGAGEMAGTSAIDDPFAESQDAIPAEEEHSHDPFGSESNSSQNAESQEDPFSSYSNQGAPNTHEAEEEDPFAQPMQDPSNAPNAVSSSDGALLQQPEQEQQFTGESPDALEKWKAGFAQRVEEKDQNDVAKRNSMKEKAEEEIDELYEERTKRNVIRSTANREAEKALLDEREAAQAASDDTPWARVAKLIDTNKKDDEGGESRARMRGLLLNLKSA